MLWGCFAAGGTGALHKIDGFMRKENYVAILKQHLKTIIRKLKFGLQMHMVTKIVLFGEMSSGLRNKNRSIWP